MIKFLSIDQMLEAGRDTNLPGLKTYVQQAEHLATNLGRALAAQLGIRAASAVWEGQAYGGLLCRFGPDRLGQACPELLHRHDSEGDWEALQAPAFSKAERRPGGMALPLDDFDTTDYALPAFLVPSLDELVAKMQQHILDDMKEGSISYAARWYGDLCEQIGDNEYRYFGDPVWIDGMIAHFGGRAESGMVPEAFSHFANQCHDAISDWLRDLGHLAGFESRLFQGSWGEGFANPGFREMAFSEINEENGYDVDDVDAILRLDVGATWQSPHYPSHKIQRTD